MNGRKTNNDVDREGLARQAKQQTKPRFYFAYGANTNVDGMRFRCKAAVAVGAATLRDYKLVFRGVADVAEREGAEVRGVVWSITPECEKSLDRFEGFPTLYVKRTVRVRLDNGRRIDAMVYVMTERDYQDVPSRFYEASLRDGYREFGLPQEQIATAVTSAALEVARTRSTHPTLWDSDADDWAAVDEWAQKIRVVAKKYGRVS